MSSKSTAIIEIGSSSIKMTLFESKKNKYSILEELRHPVRLGKDSFADGKLSRITIDEAITILKKYKKLCNEYNITEIKAIASTAVREAANVDIFLDNIKTFTGIDIELLTPSKESEYIYSAVTSSLDSDEPKGTWGIIKISTGTVDIILVEDDNIVFSRTMPLGVQKLKQIYIKEFYSEERFKKFLEVMIRHELQNLKRTIPKAKIERLYGVGFEIRELCHVVNRSKHDKIQITKKTLDNFCSKIQNYTHDEILHKLKVPHDIAETFYPASIIFLKLVKFFECNDIRIPQVSLREGIYNHHINISINNKKYNKKIERQLIANSLIVGRSLNFDEKHALKVLELAVKIFDKTKSIHNLDYKARNYLITAALLHDIGSALSYRSHHKHSFYIINEQDLLFYDKNEIKIIANIARYHRKSAPKKSHPEYLSLTYHERVLVTKLASILRIADSLDNTHLQLIKDIELVKNEDSINIKAVVENQFFTEVFSFKNKKRLFEDFFGLKLNLIILEDKNEK